MPDFISITVPILNGDNNVILIVIIVIGFIISVGAFMWFIKKVYGDLQ